MATVVVQKRQRQTGCSYLVSYRDPLSGRKKHYRTFRRQRDAQQAGNDLRYLIDLGRISEVRKSKKRLHLLTLAEVSEVLRDDWTNALRRGELREKTVVEYVYQSKHLDGIFGKRLLSEITREDLERYREEVASRLSNVTSNRGLFILKQVFKKGLAVGAVLEDPSAEIRYLSEKAHERNMYLLPGRLDGLVEASRQTKARHYMPALIFLGAEHGASKQEALSLDWPAIDFNYDGRGLIRFFRTKTEKERTEYLMPRTKEALLNWREHWTSMRKRCRITELKSELVFSRLDGTPIGRFDKAWRAARKLVGLEDFHFHDLRHTYCSNLLLAGADLKDVKEMIGHKDLATTDRYAHLHLLRIRMQQNRLAEHYAQDSEKGEVDPR